jgi:hypothetical protein
LGRRPTGDENALRLYRVYQDQAPLGVVLTRRVKGEHGVIEVVLAVDPEEQVRGLMLQRLREPEAIANALENPDWRRSFAGKRVDSPWSLGRDIPQVPSDAHESAQAIVDGARSLLVMLTVADYGSGPNLVSKHPH